MKRLPMLGLAAITLAWLGASQAPPPASAPAALSTRTTVVRFASAQPLSADDQRRLNGTPAARPASTSVALQILVELSQPVVQAKAGQVIAFTDDLGDDLAQDAAMELVNIAQSSDAPLLSKDRRAVVVSANGMGRPAAGARRVTVKGTLRVQRDSGTEAIVVKEVPLQLHSKITARNVVLELQGLYSGPSNSSVTFRTAGGDALRNVEFLDARGAPIVQSYFHRECVTLADKTVQEAFTYSIDAPLHDTATLRITLYKDVRMEDVPFETTAGIGMQ